MLTILISYGKVLYYKFLITIICSLLPVLLQQVQLVRPKCPAGPPTQWVVSVLRIAPTPCLCGQWADWSVEAHSTARDCGFHQQLARPAWSDSVQRLTNHHWCLCQHGESTQHGASTQAALVMCNIMQTPHDNANSDESDACRLRLKFQLRRLKYLDCL
jgi:hypothetical protein